MRPYHRYGRSFRRRTHRCGAPAYDHCRPRAANMRRATRDLCTAGRQTARELPAVVRGVEALLRDPARGARSSHRDSGEYAIEDATTPLARALLVAPRMNGRSLIGTVVAGFGGAAGSAGASRLRCRLQLLPQHGERVVELARFCRAPARRASARGGSVRADVEAERRHAQRGRRRAATSTSARLAVAPWRVRRENPPGLPWAISSTASARPPSRPKVRR